MTDSEAKGLQTNYLNSFDLILVLRTPNIIQLQDARFQD